MWNALRSLTVEVMVPAVLLTAAVFTALVLLSSCAPIDPKCCLGVPCYRHAAPDAGPASLRG